MSKSVNRKTERLERIEKTIAALKSCNDPEEIARIGTIEHDWMFANYQGSSAGTLISRDYLPAIDRAFPPSGGDDLLPSECWQKVNGRLIKRHLVVQTLKPTQQEWNERNKTTRNATIDRINEKLPLYPDPLINVAQSMLKSNKWQTIAAALILLTGRRPAEIAWSAEFKAAGEYSLYFSGQLKKSDVANVPYVIPTLIPATLILQAYSQLRQLQLEKTDILKSIEPLAVDRKTNRPINRAIQQHFGNLLQAPQSSKGKVTRLSASNLRAAYGRIAAHYYCPSTSEPILFVAKILGHQSSNKELESLSTTISYHTYRIVDRTGDDNNNLGIYHDRFQLTTKASQIENRINYLDNTDKIAATVPGTTNRNKGNNPEFEPRQLATKVKKPSTIKQADLTMITGNQTLPNERALRTTNLLAAEIRQQDLQTDLSEALIATQLAARLGIGKATIGRCRKRKSPRSFAIWSKERDPEGIPWIFLKTSPLPALNHKIPVDIYIPIDPTEIDNLDNSFPTNNNKTTENQSNNEAEDDRLTTIENNNSSLTTEQLNRLGVVASKLNLQADDRTNLFDRLLDWAETQLNNETGSSESARNRTTSIDADLHRDRPTEIILPEIINGFDRAVTTIAQFSQDLHSTLTPLTQQLQRAIDSFENDRKERTTKTEIDQTTTSELLAAISQLPQVNLEADSDNSTPADRDRAEKEEIKSTTQSKSIGSVSAQRQDSLDPEDLNCTLDALRTATAMKKAAINKEKKKRSKVDTNAISKWAKQIQSLESSIALLSSP